jgi:hypothetical protein
MDGRTLTGLEVAEIGYYEGMYSPVCQELMSGIFSGEGFAHANGSVSDTNIDGLCKLLYSRAMNEIEKDESITNHIVPYRSAFQ